MFSHSFGSFAKRTPGYVFWRQSSLVELEKTKRSYMASERPVPIGEISRRMARVKARYEGTEDYHARSLLRGEYKYFSGKLCDLRAARDGDMIAFLQCAALFGFWDTSQVERVMRELQMKVGGLSANEMVCLFAALPSLRKQQSPLFHQLAEELVDKVPEMTLEECVKVLRAVSAEEDVPPALLHNLMVNIEEDMESLSGTQLVDVLDAFGASPERVQQSLSGLREKLKRAAMAQCAELTSMDVAVLYTALHGLGVCDSESERVLLDAFIAKEATACARSVAMVFSAVSTSHSATLAVSQALEKRVVFLATDFTVPELLAVLRVYVDGLLSMHGVAATTATGNTTGAPRSAELAEIQVALQRRTAYQHVVAELSAQMTDILNSAASFISFPQQLEALEMLADSVAEARLLVDRPDGASEEDAEAAQSKAAVALLVHLVPELRHLAQQLAIKLITSVRAAGVPQLLRMLQLADALGSVLIGDALVAAIVHAFTVRDLNLPSAHALTLSRELSKLTNLRAEHQRRIHTSLIPKLRAFA